MACFDDVVALRELCDPTIPFSGYYLNELGINRSFIEDIITSDYTGVQDFVEKKITHAGAVIQSIVHNRFGNRVESTSLVTDHRLGFTQDNKVAMPGEGWKGIQVRLNNYSNYVNLELSEISLQVNLNGTVPILIYDLYQNKLLETVTITAVSGEIVTVYPHKLFTSHGKPLNLFIGYDATGITSVTTYIRQGQCCGITTCTTQNLVAKGATNSTGTFLNQDFTGLAHTAGLSVVYSLTCDPYAWMCAYAQTLALPIAYKAASEIYLHAMNNPMDQRSSNNTNLNGERIKTNQEFYEMQFREQMDSILSNMTLPSGTACFSCKSPAQTKIVLP